MSCIYFETVLNDFVAKLVVMQNIFLSYSRHCNQGLIVVIVYYFQIWNQKEHNIINRRIISSHMSLMYMETPCIFTSASTNEKFAGIRVL